jgi:hypothetical protein
LLISDPENYIARRRLAIVVILKSKGQISSCRPPINHDVGEHDGTRQTKKQQKLCMQTKRDNDDDEE